MWTTGYIEAKTRGGEMTTLEQLERLCRKLPTPDNCKLLVEDWVQELVCILIDKEREAKPITQEPPAETIEAKIERLIEAGYSVESGRGVNDYWLDVRKNGVGVSKHLWFKTLSEALDDALKMAGLA